MPTHEPEFALAAKGFRPFFLLAAIFAVAIVPLWLLILRGAVAPSVYFGAVTWHAHEMIFGFAVAVIAGFLLTAVANWTKRETLTGAPLVGLAALWCMGRVAFLLAGSLPRGVPAVLDLAFLPTLVIVLARPLVASKNYRNFVMLAMLVALFLANLATHLDALGLVAPETGRHACRVAVDVVVLMLVLMSGRVFPMFTRNATGIASIRAIPWLDGVTMLGMVLVVGLDVAAPDHAAPSLVSGAVGVAAALRTIHWGTRHTKDHPLVWVLHVGYAWIPIGLVLRAVSVWVPSVQSSFATHALTVGAIGTLTLGMMARVALGHTARMLVVGKAMTAAFVAMTLAAAVRALVPLFAPSYYSASLTVAGTLWAIAFALFILVNAPILSRARVDGKAG